MKVDRQYRYESSSEFFTLDGSVIMKLSRDAAVKVCELAAQRGLVVAQIEGGIWHSPGFEARLDCIWDGVDPPVELDVAEENNIEAANFIRSKSEMHDVFIITAPCMSGW
ncbi:colicin immunity protein [Achromobacter spanius]|uniref:Colicin immunity protein n=1 Tax=Achromobacter spanius TaxID=217203 RepID=A0A2S5GXC9_9BURK|nr:colicin immunity protein [Achromobacter spanius]PPA77505.1 colicin immunity protein [Achromobacter spanius]